MSCIGINGNPCKKLGKEPLAGCADTASILDDRLHAALLMGGQEWV
jgi:hypothetical protein